MNNFINDTIGGVVKTLDFKRGGGVIESLIFVMLIAAVIYLNIFNIEVSPLLEKIVIGILTYWVGRNTNVIEKEAE